MGSSKTQLAGFFITGTALGAVVTLLLAPQSGAQTRKNIRRLSKKTVDQLGDLKKGVRDQVQGGSFGLLRLMKDYKDARADRRSESRS